MNSVKKFLYWNSGAPKHLIENCPKKEQHNYLKLGLIALIPTVFAFVSGFYAFYTIIVKDNDISVVDFIVIAILASIWACAIYFIDIYIIATYRKLKKVRFQILPRIFLSLVLGLVISHPIVLKILEDPIEFKTIDIKNSQINSLDSLRINELNLKVNNEINNFNNKLEKIDSTRLSLTTEFVKEIQGKGSKKADGSPNPNRGNIANDIEIKEQKYYDEADALNEGFSKRKNYLLDTIQKQINSKWD